MFANWMKRTSTEIDSGCIYISGAVEFDDRPGPGARRAGESVSTWHAAMLRAIVQAKRKAICAPTPTSDQMLFEIHGLILALHYEARFLQEPRLHRPGQHRLRQHPAQRTRPAGRSGGACRRRLKPVR
jgi:hypothetical protein